MPAQGIEGDLMPPLKHFLQLAPNERETENTARQSHGQLIFHMIDQPACVGAVRLYAVRMLPGSKGARLLYVSKLNPGNVVPVHGNPMHLKGPAADNEYNPGAVLNATRTAFHPHGITRRN